MACFELVHFEDRLVLILPKISGYSQAMGEIFKKELTEYWNQARQGNTLGPIFTIYVLLPLFLHVRYFKSLTRLIENVLISTISNKYTMNKYIYIYHDGFNKSN